MEFAVFLDVDGVLNTRTTVKQTPYGYTGIDDARVEILAHALEKYGGGDIVLSSDWKELNPKHDDYVYLVSKLKKYGLEISGQTFDSNLERGKGIKEYLEQHSEIEEFVILDDMTFDFERYKKFWERLLLTNGIENVKFASRTPAVEAILFLNFIHVFL
ncbi:HAD domain-containing protein [Dorea formicigenerans]|uniref:Hydrolase n=1 Tax=Dorea formicigenerans TaxID=39486 RepID=A0A412MHU9_9FIRM|nr:HAD domain-containing protein [Dorea formicigenerans]RGT12202.1 hypothetical protein DWX53_01215 [Dorea formicigenerans]RHE28610.1 hypothetical protein DW756_06195 [Dorea formicigenerans]